VEIVMSTKANRKPLVELTDAELAAADRAAAAVPAEAAAPMSIPGAERPVGVLRNVELDWLVPTPRNPRGPVDTKSESFRELVASVARVGVLQNLVARPLPEAMRRDAAAYQRKLGPVPKGAVRAFPEPADMFEVVCGARRLAAARAAGLATAPVLVCELDDRQATEITFVENFARHDLRPLQEARGVQAMLDVGWPLEAVAERVGHAPGWVARRAKLLGLSKEWQALFDDEELPLRLWPAGVMESIARLRPEAQSHALDLLRPNPIARLSSLLP
jgi:ParB family chromosome partitioning protein